jgi:hypothetical protein
LRIFTRKLLLADFCNKIGTSAPWRDDQAMSACRPNAKFCAHRFANRLNAAINESLKLPELQSTLTKLSVEARISSPEEFSTFLAQERTRWAPVAQAANVKTE